MEHPQLLQNMASALGFLPAQLASIVRTAPLRYKVFQIPKRTGGLRTLAQPAREVKALQYWILGLLSPLLPIHEAATAYRIGCSIGENARKHAANPFLIKMDFTNFFPSILARDFQQHLRAHCPGLFSDPELDILARILFWAQDRNPPLRLCIGAPTSPFISNTLMFSFDQIISARCEEMQISYSRYADDLSFSTHRRNVLAGIPNIVSEVAGNLLYPRLAINVQKTVHASRKVRRQITGVIITPEGGLSVGRGRKRLARSMFLRGRLGLLSDAEMEVLRGHLSFIDSVEPGFSERLNQAYSRKPA